MCTISISSIAGQGFSSPNQFNSILVNAAVTGCDTVTIRILQGSTLIGVSTATVTGQISVSVLPHSGTFICNREYKIEVVCDKDEKCSDSKNLLLPCPPSCCPEIQIVPTVGPCKSDGSCDVTFAVTGTTVQACLPHVFELDFGDGDNSNSVLVNTAGSFVLSFAHTYAPAQGQVWTVQLSDVMHSLCPKPSASVQLPNCGAGNCCPRAVETVISFGSCNDSCDRQVQFATSFDPPTAACGPAALDIEITDKDGNPIATTLSAFSTASTSPNMQQTWLSPDGNPYQLVVKTIAPGNCPEYSQSFEVPPCEGKQACPTNLTLTATPKGCRKDSAGTCSRIVELTVSASHFASCADPNLPTKFEVFDGGSPIGSVFTFYGTGSGQQTQEILVSSAGVRNYSVIATTPSGCSAIANASIDIVACEAAECEESPPSDAPAIPCILCTKCQAFLQKIGAGFWHQLICKLLMALFVISGTALMLIMAGLATPGLVWGVIGSAAFLAWVACWILLRKLCGECCLWCAIVAFCIVAAIAVLVYGLATQFSTLWSVILTLVIIAFIYAAGDSSTRKYCDQSLP